MDSPSHIAVSITKVYLDSQLGQVNCGITSTIDGDFEHICPLCLFHQVQIDMFGLSKLFLQYLCRRSH